MKRQSCPVAEAVWKPRERLAPASQVGRHFRSVAVGRVLGRPRCHLSRSKLRRVAGIPERGSRPRPFGRPKTCRMGRQLSAGSNVIKKHRRAGRVHSRRPHARLPRGRVVWQTHDSPRDGCCGVWDQNTRRHQSRYARASTIHPSPGMLPSWRAGPGDGQLHHGDDLMRRQSPSRLSP